MCTQPLPRSSTSGWCLQLLFCYFLAALYENQTHPVSQVNVTSLTSTEMSQYSKHFESCSVWIIIKDGASLNPPPSTPSFWNKQNKNSPFCLRNSIQSFHVSSVLMTVKLKLLPLQENMTRVHFISHFIVKLQTDILSLCSHWVEFSTKHVGVF